MFDVNDTVSMAKYLIAVILASIAPSMFAIYGGVEQVHANARLPALISTLALIFLLALCMYSIHRSILQENDNKSEFGQLKAHRNQIRSRRALIIVVFLYPIVLSGTAIFAYLSVSPLSKI